MIKDTCILIADDDVGHARLIEKNLERAGLKNRILRFEDGQLILDFLFNRANTSSGLDCGAYLLLLDIRMPKVDGVQVLREIKSNSELRKLPVIMLTTTDDPQEIARCHDFGCSNYIVKPVDYEVFSATIKQLGTFITLVRVPEIKRSEAVGKR